MKLVNTIQPNHMRTLLHLFTLLVLHFLTMPSITLAYNEESSADLQLTKLANDYYDLYIEYQQPYSYASHFNLENDDKFLINDLKLIQRYQQEIDLIQQQLLKITTQNLTSHKAKIFYAKFTESLASSKDKRICKTELWNINHISGSHTLLDSLITVQPLQTNKNKSDALLRWGAASKYYSQEIENLNLGLKQGYSMPKRVVKRMITQLENLTKSNIGPHPYLKLLNRTNDIVFKKEFTTLVKEQLIPAIKTYLDYLKYNYLPEARTELGLHAQPNGRACYIALYRSYTSLKRTPEEVFDQGYKLVELNKKDVISLGISMYGVNGFTETIKVANADSSELFNDMQQMRQFYSDAILRAKSKLLIYFNNLPNIKLAVEPIAKYLQGIGTTAHYLAGTELINAKFKYDPTTYSLESIASAELITVHEGYPGHHMQIALSQEQMLYHPIEVLFTNSAYGEGWAKYAEVLAEEAGIYQSMSTRILRRTWSGRAMVADTAMHVLGWNNNSIARYLSESGKSFAKSPAVMMDRMAAMPAQLTSYDTGALEILRLRKVLEQAQGVKFDIKEFHDLILKNGNVPLSVLKSQVSEVIN